MYLVKTKILTCFNTQFIQLTKTDISSEKRLSFCGTPEVTVKISNITLETFHTLFPVVNK